MPGASEPSAERRGAEPGQPGGSGHEEWFSEYLTAGVSTSGCR